jgi:hypothetical protein
MISRHWQTRGQETVAGNGQRALAAGHPCPGLTIVRFVRKSRGIGRLTRTIHGTGTFYCIKRRQNLVITLEATCSRQPHWEKHNLYFSNHVVRARVTRYEVVLLSNNKQNSSLLKLMTVNIFIHVLGSQVPINCPEQETWSSRSVKSWYKTFEHLMILLVAAF